MKVTYTPRARREFDEAADYYDGQSPGLGDQFETELDEALDTLSYFPESGRLMTKLVRKKRIGSFPYAMLYTLRKDTLIVLRVIHLQSNPKYWLD